MLQNLKKLQSLINNSTVSRSLQEADDEDIILFIGNSKSGKSTIVNHVIGNPLKSEHVGKKKYRINQASTDFAGPAIGVESTSETTVPTAWTSDRISGLIVDAPGFDDNRGEVQDIANVFHIRNILTCARSAKIVLILDINDIAHDNVGQFISLVDKVKLMFPNVGPNLNAAITFVLTKDDNETTRSEVCEYFNKKILSQPLMKVNNRELVEYLSRNQNHIVLIRMPDSERNLNPDDEVFDDLIGTIENVSSKLDKTYLQNINFGLSEKSKAFLHEARIHLYEQRDFENALNICLTLFTQNLSHFDQVFRDVERGNNLENDLQALNGRIQENIEGGMDCRGLLQALNGLVPGNSVLNYEIYNKLNFITFVNKILNIDDSGFLIAKAKITLSKMRSEIMQKIHIVQGRIRQLQDEEEARQRRIEEEDARKRREEEDARKRREEEDARRRREQEDERRAKDENDRRRTLDNIGLTLGTVRDFFEMAGMIGSLISAVNPAASSSVPPRTRSRRPRRARRGRPSH